MGQSNNPRRTKAIAVVFIIAFWLTTWRLPAHSTNDEIDEDDIFSQSELVVDTMVLEDDSISSEVDKASVSLSGSIYNRNRYAAKRKEYILKSAFTENDGDYEGSLTANLLLDLRYKDGIKGFANADFEYYFKGINQTDDADTVHSEQYLREVFVDFNVKRKVYFRVGRQYLKWGPNYFWNPTDLINVDKKDFLDPRKNLQGTKGIKIHAPFGTRYNIYGFVNLEDVGNLEDVAWAGKFEFITGDTEMSISGWYKKRFNPVVCYDFSTRVFRIDWRGEISVSRGKDMPFLLNETIIDKPEDTSELVTIYKERWIPRISLGFTKSFDLMDINDRIDVTGEFYYNHAGFDHNAFDDQDCVNSLLSRGLYEPNHVSRYYASFFTSIKRFIVSNGVLNMNYLSNLTDHSGIFYLSFQYNFRYDFFIDFSFSQTTGNGNDEYTFSGNNMAIGLEFRYHF